jgi:transposase InsO family protein
VRDVVVPTSSALASRCAACHRRRTRVQEVFDAACRGLGIRHTRTKPRHAWTNGFVERLQGTILQEHWRVAFRRHYFTSRAALQRSLEAFMRYYNTERPHQGYRVRGRTPAALVCDIAGQ